MNAVQIQAKYNRFAIDLMKRLGRACQKAGCEVEVLHDRAIKADGQAVEFMLMNSDVWRLLEQDLNVFPSHSEQVDVIPLYPKEGINPLVEVIATKSVESFFALPEGDWADPDDEENVARLFEILEAQIPEIVKTICRGGRRQRSSRCGRQSPST